MILSFQLQEDPSSQVLSHDESAISSGQNRISDNFIHFPPVLPGYLQQDLSNCPQYQTTSFVSQHSSLNKSYL